MFVFEEEGRLQGIISTHVDDFLYVSSLNFERKVIDRLNAVMRYWVSVLSGFLDRKVVEHK